MAIVINANDGTISGVAVGGLPDGIVDAGTLATNSVDSAELIDGAIDTAHIGTDQITSAILPAGSVLQVVQAVSEDDYTFSTSSTDEVDVTGMAITITPSATSSKILLWFQCGTEANGAINGLTITLYRDTTPIKENAQYSFPSTSGWNAGIAGFNYLYLDSPSTTSATTYKIAQENEIGGTMHWNWGTSTNGMTVIAQEIAG